MMDYERLKHIELKNLMYGHPGRFIQSLKGQFNIQKMTEKQPIQIGQLTCGCWTVPDGNNRIGLILQKNIDSRLEIIPERYISIYPKGEWDEETFHWWNEYPKTFEIVMKYSKEVNKIRKRKSTFSGDQEYKEEINKFMRIIDKEKHICIDLRLNN